MEAALVLPCIFLGAGAFLSFGLEQYLCVKENSAEHLQMRIESPWKGAGKALTADILIEEGKEVLPQ